MLRFDITGVGESEGDFIDSTFSTRIDDTLSALRAWQDLGHTPTLLVGHSIGGTAALTVAPQAPFLSTVVTVGSPHSARALMDKFYDLGMITPLENDVVEVTVAGRPYRLRKAFIDDMYAHDSTADTAALQKVLRVFHAPHDAISSFDNAEKIYAAATVADKKLIPLSDTATHLLEKGDADADMIADEIIKIIKK
jgi:putative redox protein